MSEFSSSDQLNSLQSSFSDIYVDLEEKILQKSQAVERFIQTHQKDENNSVCFTFLQQLFSIFKSEFMTNLSLRQALIKHQELVEIDQKCNDSIGSFLQKFHYTFPNLCKDANSLEEINQFSRKLFTQLNKYSSSNNTKQIYHDLIQQQNQLQQRNTELKQECLSFKQKEEFSFAEKQQNYQNLRIKEEDLTDKYNSLTKEHSNLEKMLQSFPIIDNLHEKIKEVEQRSVTVVSNITTMKAKFRRKIQKRKMKIEKFQIDIKELKENRLEIEKELDSVQAKIDYLTSPLAIPHDEMITSPNEVRFQVIDLQKKLEALKQQQNEENLNIKQIESQILDLNRYAKETNDKISEKKIELENLNKTFLKQQNILQYINENQAKITKINDQLKILNETKRSLKFDKIRLNRKLDDINSQWMQLAINNKSLKKTESLLETQKNKAIQEIQQSTLSDYDKEMFELVLDANRKLREELLLSLNATPKEISDIVISRYNSI